MELTTAAARKRSRRVTWAISIALVALGSYWLADGSRQNATKGSPDSERDPTWHLARDSQAASPEAMSGLGQPARSRTPVETASQPADRTGVEDPRHEDHATSQASDHRVMAFDSLPTDDAADRKARPACWKASDPDHFSIALDFNQKSRGNASATLSAVKDTPQPGMLFQSIDAADLRGKHVEFSADMRTELAKRGAGLWIRADDARGQLVAIKQALLYTPDYDSSGNIDWKRLSAGLDIPHEARMVSYGLTMGGVGRTWMDNARIDISASTGVVTGTVLNTMGFRPDPDNLAIKPSNLDFESDLVAGCPDQSAGAK